MLTNAFRDLGHEAFSCHIQPAYGPSVDKGWHLQGDVKLIMKEKGPFDLICLFPLCVYLPCVGNTVEDIIDRYFIVSWPQ